MPGPSDYLETVNDVGAALQDGQEEGAERFIQEMSEAATALGGVNSDAFNQYKERVMSDPRIQAWLPALEMGFVHLDENEDLLDEEDGITVLVEDEVEDLVDDLSRSRTASNVGRLILAESLENNYNAIQRAADEWDSDEDKYWLADPDVFDDFATELDLENYGNAYQNAALAAAMSHNGNALFHALDDHRTSRWQWPFNYGEDGKVSRDDIDAFVNDYRDNKLDNSSRSALAAAAEAGGYESTDAFVNELEHWADNWGNGRYSGFGDDDLRTGDLVRGAGFENTDELRRFMAAMEGPTAGEESEVQVAPPVEELPEADAAAVRTTAQGIANRLLNNVSLRQDLVGADGDIDFADVERVYQSYASLENPENDPNYAFIRNLYTRNFSMIAPGQDSISLDALAGLADPANNSWDAFAARNGGLELYQSQWLDLRVDLQASAGLLRSAGVINDEGIITRESLDVGIARFNTIDNPTSEDTAALDALTRLRSSFNTLATNGRLDFESLVGEVPAASGDTGTGNGSGGGGGSGSGTMEVSWGSQVPIDVAYARLNDEQRRDPNQVRLECWRVLRDAAHYKNTHGGVSIGQNASRQINLTEIDRIIAQYEAAFESNGSASVSGLPRYVDGVDIYAILTGTMII